MYSIDLICTYMLIHIISIGRRLFGFGEFLFLFAFFSVLLVALWLLVASDGF